MQTVSSIYLEGMGEMVRKPSRMRLTFHYPTGDIVYNNADIVKVTEKKTAHLIAGELPAIELEMELMNLDGSFNPNDISGIHDLIIKGVLVNYEFGYDVPNLQYYGYTDGGEHDYGMEENVPYGFMEGYATEWIPGGEVFTSGEISYSKTTATISAKDYLSFLDEHVLLAYGNRTLAQVAKDVLSLTDYPKELDGDPKIITGPELDAFNTAITLSETEDESISAKEHLQTIAHACGVQMYIDRLGYIHLDNDKRGLTSVYTLPLSQQGEEPEHRKEQMPKKMVIVLNSEYGDPVEVDLNGGGETMTVENPFIVTTAEGEALSGVVYDHFIKYRNTADIPYRGEPALDILDTITLGTEFGGDVEAIVVGTELEFDGTLSGSLSVRYQLGGNTPEKVQIKGSGNFIYPLGVEDEPSITSFNLLCDTTFPAPTYQWSYFTVSNGSWLNIAGATSNTINVAYNSSYYNNDSSVKFRCVVNGVKGAITQISKIKLQKSETAGYRGTVVATSPASINVPSPVVGDVVLMDNTSDGTATVYGEAHVYNGEEWVATEESDALAMTYKDALQLAKDSGKTIYASEIYADLIVTKRLRVEDNGYIAVINKDDGIRASYNGEDIFRAYTNGDAEFGKYNPSTKSGGIFYDREQDKLLGNVAYDQWDLVIQSSADFNLLAAGDYTQYKRVLVVSGEYNITQRIALGDHYVENFEGLGSNTILKINYNMGDTSLMDAGIFLKEIGNFTVDINATQSGTTFSVINVFSSGKLLRDITITCSPKQGKGYGIRINNITNARTTKVQNCYVSGMNIGYEFCLNSLYCIADDCNSGFNYCHYSTGCKAVDCSGNGFYQCEGLAACIAQSNNYGFYECYGMGGCQAFGNTTLDKKDGYEEDDFRATSITTNAITATSIDTGHGANEVYKITNEAITAYRTAVQMSAMVVGEIRFVYASLTSDSDGSPEGSVLLPAGGSYLVANFYDNAVINIRWTGTPSGMSPIGIPGGTKIVYNTNNSYKVVYFLVRRIS